MQNKIKIWFILDSGRTPYYNLLKEHLGCQGLLVEKIFVSKTFSLLKTILFHRTNILHFHCMLRFICPNRNIKKWCEMLLFFGALFLVRISGTVIVWTVHELYDKHPEQKLNISSIAKHLIKKTIDRFIVHSPDIKKEIINIFGITKTQIRIIPLASYIGHINNSISRTEARKKLNIDQKKFVFLFFGNIIDHKGILEAIDAFEKLRGHNDFLICGRPTNSELVDNIKEKARKLGNIILKLDFVPNDDIQIYMNASDCLVLPYKKFTTSGVVCLGMSFALPVIAPNMGQFKYILNHNGAFLYDNTNRFGLVNSMRNAIKNKNQLRKMGKYNLNKAKTWNFEKISYETKKVYYALLYPN